MVTLDEFLAGKRNIAPPLPTERNAEIELLKQENQRLRKRVADLELDKSWRDNPDRMGR